MQHCFKRPLPPNFTLFLQKQQLPQTTALQAEHRNFFNITFTDHNYITITCLTMLLTDLPVIQSLDSVPVIRYYISAVYNDYQVQYYNCTKCNELQI